MSFRRARRFITNEGAYLLACILCVWAVLALKKICSPPRTDYFSSSGEGKDASSLESLVSKTDMDALKKEYKRRYGK